MKQEDPVIPIGEQKMNKRLHPIDQYKALSSYDSYFPPGLYLTPSAPINNTNSQYFNPIHCFQIDRDLTEIGCLRRKINLYHVYLPEFLMDWSEITFSALPHPSYTQSYFP